MKSHCVELSADTHLHSIIVLLGPPLVGVACIINTVKVDEHQIRLVVHNELVHVQVAVKVGITGKS